jgi:hypothetical protein
MCNNGDMTHRLQVVNIWEMFEPGIMDVVHGKG